MPDPEQVWMDAVRERLTAAGERLDDTMRVLEEARTLARDLGCPDLNVVGPRILQEEGRVATVLLALRDFHEELAKAKRRMLKKPSK